MPLLEFWRAAPDSVLRMNVEAIVRMAGVDGGRLRDGNEASIEFRQFLREVDSEKLADYATFCLRSAFEGSGHVLQDVINEVGRRLGFHVENGRYQGNRSDIGYDGIWSAEGESLVVEVKTTDTYTTVLDVIGNYRDRLVESQRVPKETPILLVIGRDDTDSLEAQVRGSRHAWSMRIIGIESLLKLMEINLTTSSDAVTSKIHKILRPFEYTRIDGIVDVVFTTAEDKESEVESPETEDAKADDGTEQNAEQRSQDRTPNEIINERKRLLIDRLGRKAGKPLQQRRHSMYSDVADQVHAVVAISKRYEPNRYWYAYHSEPQRKFIKDAKEGVMILGTTDTEDAFAVPFAFLEKHWGDLNSTVTKGGREYKHVKLVADPDFLLLLNTGRKVSIEPFRL